MAGTTIEVTAGKAGNLNSTAAKTSARAPASVQPKRRRRTSLAGLTDLARKARGSIER